MTHYAMKNILLTFLVLFSVSANADLISLSSLPAVTRAGGVKYTEALGYRFETQLYGTLIAIPGGLWNGDAFGTTTPITISRIDGGLFSLADFSITTHAAFACGGGGFCGVEGLQAEGTKGDGGSAFAQFYDSGYANDLNLFGLDPELFFDLKTATIYAPDSFVLHSVNLTANPAAVPLPAAAWLFAAGLMLLLHKPKHGHA